MDSTTHDESLSLAGIVFRGTTRRVLLADLDRLKLIFPVNAELILLAQNDSQFRGILSKHYSTLDGFWPYLIVRLRKQRRVEKISGSELSHDVFAYAARNNLKVFFLGAMPDVNRTAREKVALRYGIEVDGYSPEFAPYPYPAEMNERVLAEIRRSQPQILLIAFGAPKQEFWLDEHQADLVTAGIRLGIAVGGTLDMLAGVYHKAPAFICSIGLEGVWRVVQDPKRIKRFPNPLRFFRIALR